jgi:hypothetical protein
MMTRRSGVAVVLLALVLVGCPPALAAANVAGVWKLVPVNAPDGQSPREAVLTLKQEGEKITGSLYFDEKDVAIQEAAITGNELKFKIVSEREGEKIEATIKATLDGDTLKGTATPQGGEERVIHFTGKRAAAPQPAATLTGVWTLAIETPNQTYKPTVTLTQEGEKLMGTLRTEDGTEAKLVSGSLKGDVIAFVVDLTVGERDLHLEFSGKRTDKGLKGDVAVGEQSFPWTGERAAAAAAKEPQK